MKVRLGMKYIKIFLASSIEEFAKERKELGDYIRSLNDIYVKRGIYFQLNLCEDLSNALSGDRKQDEYDRLIRESDYFYVIFGRKAGEYTIEEFDTALRQFQESGRPGIYTYFMKLPDERERAESVQRFMERLDRQLLHFYSMFEHLDSIKLNILLEISRDPQVNGKIVFEDGSAFLNEQKVLCLENIPIYGRNEALQKLRKEKEALDMEFADLRAELVDRPDDEELFRKIMTVSAKREQVGERLRQTEADVLKLCSSLMQHGDIGAEGRTWREKKAGEYFKAGEYEKALVILKDEERKKELEHAEEIIEKGLQIIKGYISENRLKILALQGQGINGKNADELEACYAENAELAKKHRIEPECLYEYADFLSHQHKSAQALAAIEELEKIYEASEEADDRAWLRLYELKGSVCIDLCDFRPAERYLRKSADLCGLTGDRDVKMTVYNNYAMICARRGKIGRAEKYFRMVLQHCEEEDENGRETALVCGNLAEMLNCMYWERPDEALREEIRGLYERAVEIERRLNESERTKDLPRLSEVHYNLANYWFEHGDKEKAGPLYEEALEIGRRAAFENPAGEMIRVAQRIEGLAYWHDDRGQFDRSEPLYLEAIGLVEKIRALEPELHQDVHAHLLNNYAYMLLMTGRRKESAKCYRRAIGLYEILVQKDPEVFHRELTMCRMSLNRVL